MRKLLLMSAAIAVAGLTAFWIGQATRSYDLFDAHAAGKVFPKVTIDLAIDGIAGAFPVAVTGLETSCEILEIDDGRTTRKRPGRVKYGDITLKKGYARPGDPLGTEMQKWFQKVRNGEIERKNGAVILKAADGSEVARYEFFDAWPCKWKGFDLADTSAISPGEEFTLAVGAFKKAR